MVEEKVLLPVALIHAVHHLEASCKLKPSISGLFSQVMKD